MLRCATGGSLRCEKVEERYHVEAMLAIGAGALRYSASFVVDEFAKDIIDCRRAEESWALDPHVRPTQPCAPDHGN